MDDAEPDDEPQVAQPGGGAETASSFTGHRDAYGRRSGRGTLVNGEDGSVIRGRFVAGVAQGRCVMEFCDGSSLTGVFADGLLQGEGEYYSPCSGLLMRGHFQDSALSGHGCELDTLDECRLVFEGEYEDNVRVRGTLHFADGGSIEGSFGEDDGELCGDDVCYWYDRSSPWPHCGLRGVWSGGEMVRGWPVGFSDLPPDLAEAEYTHDPSTAEVISSDPLLRDPWESKLVYVKESSIPGAGEGLFTKVDVPAGVVVAFYNGIRISQEECDARDWSENANCITLEEESDTSGTVIDVPEDCVPLDAYCASLGHKANHSFSPNAKYDVFEHHPRFGHIKCVRTIQPIPRDREILVTYDYDVESPDSAPDWFLAALRQVRDGGSGEKKRKRKRGM